MESEFKKKFLIDFTYLTVILGLIFLVCKFLLSYLLPFIISAIIAFLMQKPALYISRKIKLKKGIIAALLSAFVYIFVAAIVTFSVYKLIVFSTSLTEWLPQILTDITSFANTLRNKFSDLIPETYAFALDEFWKNVLNNISRTVSSFLSNVITLFAKKMPSLLFSSIVALVASCYIAKDYTVLLKFIKELCGKKTTENIIKIKTILFESVFKLLKGYLILTIFTFVQLFIGFTILKVKHALLIALIISFVDILPVLGTGTILIPWSFVAGISGDIVFAIGLTVLYIIVIIIRNFAEPKVIGTQIGINPLFTLIAMFIGLRLLGVIGLFLFPIILIVVIKYYKNQMQEGLSV